MTSARQPYKGFRVTRGGRIDRFGTIHVLSESVAEPSDPAMAIGSREYSPLLHPYGNGTYCAAILEGELRVLDSTGMAVATIPPTELNFVVFAHACRVLPSGYVLHLHEDFAHYAKQIETAAAGKAPTTCDNSPFARVSQELAGREVFELTLSRDRSIVFKLTGEQVPCTVDQPLAYERWGKSLPQPGRDDWDIY